MRWPDGVGYRYRGLEAATRGSVLLQVLDWPSLLAPGHDDGNLGAPTTLEFI